MIKTEMVFSVQENGSFHVINNGEKVGIIRKSAGSEGWHIDNDKQASRISPFYAASEARKFAVNNRNTF